MTATLHQLPAFFLLLCLKSTILLAATLVCLRLAEKHQREQPSPALHA